MCDPGSFPSNARHWLHLKALGPCPFQEEQWDGVSSEVQAMEDSAEPQQLLPHTDSSHISTPPVSLDSHTKLLGSRSHVLCSRLHAPCETNANRVLVQDQAGTRCWEKPVAHRKEPRRSRPGAVAQISIASPHTCKPAG